MGNLKLSRLISSGMVLQRDKKAHIWGYDMPGRGINVAFMDDIYKTVTDDKGCFGVWLNPQPYGGPYTLTVSDDAGESVTVDDVLIGEVWLCSGQSNMELPMERVKDMFPDELVNCDNPNIREFKIAEAVDFTSPLREPATGRWRRPDRAYIKEFSATAYFFAKELNALTGIPVGFIDASLGGSKIHCWMSREMLKGYDDKLALAARYADDTFREAALKGNEDGLMRWHEALDAKDIGLNEHWEAADTDTGDWKTFTVPGFFRDSDIGNLLGVIYFRRSFDVPSQMAGKPAKLWLGTIVDSDITYINGEPVGRTEYQYPPRKYDIREGLLKEGFNNITVRVKAEYYLEFLPGKVSGGRFTPGKEYKIFNDDGTIDLAGEWKYRIGAEADCEGYRQDFVSWKPMGLYNAMTAPCHKYTIGGVNWYQGESDCEESDEYTDLFNRMVEGYRKEWNDTELPVYVVQLPNFTIDNNPDSDAWNRMREVLRTAAEGIDNCDSMVAIDLGEDNDLHPQNKKELGRRLALLAAHDRCGKDVECYGPKIEKFVCVKEGEGAVITLNMSHTGDGMETREANGRGSDGVVRDMYIKDDKGNILPADVTVLKDKLVLNIDSLEHSVKEIRYCYAQSNSGALIYNSEGLPLSPGIYRL